MVIQILLDNIFMKFPKTESIFKLIMETSGFDTGGWETAIMIDGEVFSYGNWGHWDDIMEYMGTTDPDDIQDFLDSGGVDSGFVKDGVYHTREKAMVIWKRDRGLKSKGDSLDSDDLYSLK